MTHILTQEKSGQGYQHHHQLNPPCHTQQQHPDGFARIYYSLRATTRVTPNYGYLNKIHLQAIILSSSNPRDKGKTVSQAPLPSPTTRNLHPLETAPTSFEVGKSSKTSTTNPRDNHSKVLSLAITHPTPPLEPSPPTTAPIVPRPSLVTSIKKQIQTSKEWLSNLLRPNKSPPSKDHVSIFMAETQTEEDLL